MQQGRWRQPTDERWAAAVPWLAVPLERLDLLLSVGEIERESTGLGRFNARPWRTGSPTSFPEADWDPTWLDPARALIIAVNREPGADVAIALDLRARAEDPRVVGSVYVEKHPLTSEERSSVRKGVAFHERDLHLWREVSPRLSDFLQTLLS